MANGSNPEWSDAPSWARWHVVDCFGTGIWCELRPKIATYDTTYGATEEPNEYEDWDTAAGKSETSGFDIDLRGDEWRDSLVYKPSEV